MAAWRIAARCADARGRFVDHYTVVRLVETLNNGVIGAYRLTDIRRSTAGGRWIPTPVEEMAARNPEWGEAGPRAEWIEVKREARFSAEPLTQDEAFVTIQPDSDVTLAARHVERSIMVTTKRGRALGFQVNVVGPSRVHLGHFRHDGQPGRAVTANVHVMRSRSGRHLAALTRFEVKERTEMRTVSYGRVVGVPPAEMAATSALPHYPATPTYTDVSIQFAELLSRAADLDTLLRY